MGRAPQWLARNGTVQVPGRGSYPREVQLLRPPPPLVAMSKNDLAHSETGSPTFFAAFWKAFFSLSVTRMLKGVFRTSPSGLGGRPGFRFIALLYHGLTFRTTVFVT